MNNESGLTLLEVMVTMIVLTIGLLGLAPMIVLSVDGNSMSQDVLTVSNMAKEPIEFYQGAAVMPAMPFKSSQSLDGGAYTRVVEIWDNSSDPTMPDNVCHMDVTISWTDKTGMARTSKYSTLIEKE